MQNQELTMPIYEFECLDCKALFEKIVRSADAAKDVSCKNCNSGNIQKTISAGSYKLNPSPSLPAAGCAGKSRFT
jgi:putative FmdB family regulatory protein